MDSALKESVATLLCHIIKINNKDINVERELFFDFMEENFELDIGEIQRLFDKLMQQEYDDVDRHLSITSNALYNQPYPKMKILNQLNSMILKGGDISDEDYEFFEKVKENFFKK
jgi:uncharacterized tellurite resistance protein B-like protein